MVSQKILPLHKRLDAQQINALQGFSIKAENHLGSVDKNALLLWYHKALLAAEAEIQEGEKSLEDLKDDIKSIIQ